MHILNTLCPNYPILTVLLAKCGIDEYRRRRAAGETPFPPPTVLPNGREFEIPTPDGRHLKFRVFGENISVPKGVFYHIHGGGYVLGSASG